MPIHNHACVHHVLPVQSVRYAVNRYEEDDIDALGQLLWLALRLVVVALAFLLLWGML